MKRERRKKSPKTKIWLAGLLGVLLMGMLGACGGENQSEPVDRSMPVIEDVAGEPDNIQESEGLELIAEILPKEEMEAEVTKEIVTESIATSESIAEPTSTPVPTPEPTPAPTSTPVTTLEPTATPSPTAEPVVEKTTPTGTDYILNTNTYKFHYPSCSSVKQMKDKNKAYFTGTREECIGMGYDPCGRCEP